MKLILLCMVVGLTSCSKLKKEQPQPQRPVVELPPALIPGNEVEPDLPDPDSWTEKTFEGEWRTTRNRRLDGIMKCHVRRNGDVYDCRFWGTWQGIDFEYNVKFDGPLDDLKGHPCTIDGARYQWKGSIVDGVFKGDYESNRYDGWFELKEKGFKVPHPEK